MSIGSVVGEDWGVPDEDGGSVGPEWSASAYATHYHVSCIQGMVIGLIDWFQRIFSLLLFIWVDWLIDWFLWFWFNSNIWRFYWEQFQLIAWLWVANLKNFFAFNILCIDWLFDCLIEGSIDWLISMFQLSALRLCLFFCLQTDAANIPAVLKAMEGASAALSDKLPATIKLDRYTSESFMGLFLDNHAEKALKEYAQSLITALHSLAGKFNSVVQAGFQMATFINDSVFRLKISCK